MNWYPELLREVWTVYDLQVIFWSDLAPSRVSMEARSTSVPSQFDKWAIWEKISVANSEFDVIFKSDIKLQLKVEEYVCR